MGITNNLDVFVDCIYAMRNQGNIHFALVGSGDLKEKYQSKLNCCDNVTFLQRLPQNEVNSFLQECDILYLSTKDSKVWKYGQSMNKVVEYMLAGKPIIASYTGYPSMINEAECGYFVKTNTIVSLEEIFSYMGELSNEERKKIGRNGQEWIHQNSQSSLLADQYLQKMKSLM